MPPATGRKQLEASIRTQCANLVQEDGEKLLTRMKSEGGKAAAIRLVEDAAEQVDSACAKTIATLEEQTWIWGFTTHPLR
jgi:hypothetical protein